MSPRKDVESSSLLSEGAGHIKRSLSLHEPGGLFSWIVEVRKEALDKDPQEESPRLSLTTTADLCCLLKTMHDRLDQARRDCSTTLDSISSMVASRIASRDIEGHSDEDRVSAAGELTIRGSLCTATVKLGFASSLPKPGDKQFNAIMISLGVPKSSWEFLRPSFSSIKRAINEAIEGSRPLPHGLKMRSLFPSPTLHVTRKKSHDEIIDELAEDSKDRDYGSDQARDKRHDEDVIESSTRHILSEVIKARRRLRRLSTVLLSSS